MAFTFGLLNMSRWASLTLRVDEPVEIAVGRPIPPQEIAAHGGDAKALMDFLREATYSLSDRPVRAREYGKEFEDFYKA